MRPARAAVLAIAAVGASVSGADSRAPPGGGSDAPQARARVEELRRQFSSDILGPTASKLVLVGDGIASPTSEESVARPAARVTLPKLADGVVTVIDQGSAIAVHLRMRGTVAAPSAIADGRVVYAGAHAGGDLVERPRIDGVEDFVIFTSRPTREEITYDLELSGAASLRSIGGVVEILDAHGAPRLRAAAPYVIDADRRRVLATLHVTGCLVDTDPAPPWDRPVVEPGARTCELHVGWSGVTYPALVDPSWTTTSAPVVARLLATATLLANGRVLLTGGFETDIATATAELFDPTTATFALTGSMAAARAQHGAAPLASGKVLVAGGYRDGGLQSAELYDPVTGTFSATGGLATSPRYSFAMLALLSGDVMVQGGTSDGSAFLGTVEIYRAGMARFVQTGSLSSGRIGAAVALLPSGKVLVAGGSSDAAAYATAELYEPTTGTFSATGSMSGARDRPSATLLPTGKVLIVGGSRYLFGPLASAELYDPALGTFVATGVPFDARLDHGATRLVSGKVLLTGGFGKLDVLASAELYDPASGSFAKTSSMSKARYNHTATLLQSGKVLVVDDGTAEILGIATAGEPCTLGDDCATGSCNNGRCCAASCSGVCRACAPGTGACVVVTNADDPDTCTGPSTCSAAGSCKPKLGQPCSDGSSCASGFCADGFCCSTSCSGSCDACNVASRVGTCVPSPTGSPGSPSCSPFVCDGRSACATTCSGDDACAAGATCDLTRQVCVGAATCDGDHIVSRGPDTIDCAPYRCENSGTCKLACRSIDDCVAPLACDPDGSCVSPNGAATDSGCAVRRPRSASADLGCLSMAVLGIASWLRWRSRTKRRHTPRV